METILLVALCITVFAAGYVTGMVARPQPQIQQQVQVQDDSEDRLQKQVENIMNYFGSERGQQQIDE